MKQTFKNTTEYFRNSLEVQNQSVIDFKNIENGFEIISRERFMQGNLESRIYENFNKKIRGNFENSSEIPDEIDVIIAARTIRNQILEGDTLENNIEELTGIFYIPAKISSNNYLFPSLENKKPWFAREVLEPMIETPLSIGRVEDSDIFIENTTANRIKIKRWDQYVQYCKEYYEAVAKRSFNQDDFNDDVNFEHNMYVFIDESIQATYHIKQLYNELLRTEEQLQLYEKYMKMSVEPAFSPIQNNSIKKMIEHCGQMGGEYPLAKSQREAVNHFGELINGDVLAVSGPPGTGKTTLLQSIVANLFVSHALKKEKAPIIVASSTNNQAVTNIIDSFGKIDPIGIKNIEKRWISRVTSFALFYPANGKMKEAKEKSYQYTDLHWNFFASQFDSDEILFDEKKNYIKECNDYFTSNFLDIENCQKKIHEELVAINGLRKNLFIRLEEISQITNNESVIIIIEKCKNNKNIIESNLEYIIDEIEKNKILYQQRKERLLEWEMIYTRIPWILRVLSFIPFIKKKILIELKLKMNEEEALFLNYINNYDDIRGKYADFFIQNNLTLTEYKVKKSNFNIQLEKCESELNKYQGFLVEIRKYIDKLRELNCDIWYMSEKDGNEKNSKKQKENAEKNIGTYNLVELNNLVDTRVRYIEFWLAVHYYEGEFLACKKISSSQKKSNIREIFIEMYNRLAMITPCMVMTFFMLPKNFKVYNNNDKVSTYLYNFIDLLIVDEAGQVSPEIAAPAFALAKKALVVGDEEQISPVWGTGKALDMTLAIQSKVITRSNEFKKLQEYGLNCSESSVMKVAKNSCNFDKHGKGLFLSEHRRCYDEIIEFCNDLVYGNYLEPCRGKGKNDINYPLKEYSHMAHYNIETSNSKRRGTSRINQIEAEEIAKWLKLHYERIEQAYIEQNDKQKKDEILAIITPFKAQVLVIKRELTKALNDNAKNISVGTVHTFQGAERKIIILSTVYGSQEQCFFINANKSLINVAVSRAKDAFWIFGAYDCLSDDYESVSGKLKKYTNEDITQIS